MRVRWIRERFEAPSFEELGPPGSDLVDAGLDALAAGRVSAEALAVSLAVPRLRREGVPVGSVLDDPELRLYDLLEERDGDLAHARYNAFLPAQLLSKIVRGFRKDLLDARHFLQSGMVEAEPFRTLVHQIPASEYVKYPSLSHDAVTLAVDELLSNEG